MTTPTHDNKQQSPTMDQQDEGNVTNIEENDEETEEEYQRTLEEVREGRQHRRPMENIKDDILQRNISFNQHPGDEQGHRPTLADHIITQVRRLKDLRDIQRSDDAEEMTDKEFVHDIMTTSKSTFPEIYEIYEEHQNENLQWSIQTMRLHTQEFKLDEKIHEELCAKTRAQCDDHQESETRPSRFQINCSTIDHKHIQRIRNV